MIHPEKQNREIVRITVEMGEWKALELEIVESTSNDRPPSSVKEVPRLPSRKPLVIEAFLSKSLQRQELKPQIVWHGDGST